MSKPFQFRHTRLIAGALIFGCLILLGLATFKGTLPFFVDDQHAIRVIYTLPTTKPAEPAKPTTDAKPGTTRVPTPPPVFVRGSRVELLGQNIGVVGHVERGPSPPGGGYSLIGVLKLHSDFVELIRADSTVYLRHDMAGFGGVYLEIIPGLGDQPSTPLEVKDAGSALSEMEAFADVLKKRLTVLVDTVEKMLAEEGKVTLALDSLTKMVTKTNDTLTSSDALIKDLQKAIKLDEKNNLNALAGSAQTLMTGLSGTSTKIDDLTGKIGKIDFSKLESQMVATSRTLEATSKAIEDMSRSFEKTSDAMQKTWLLRSAVEKVEAEEQQKKGSRSKPAPAAAKTKAAAAPPPAPKPPGFFSRLFQSSPSPAKP